MLMLLRQAIAPLSLGEAMRNWQVISEKLRESPRARQCQLDRLAQHDLLT